MPTFDRSKDELEMIERLLREVADPRKTKTKVLIDKLQQRVPGTDIVGAPFDVRAIMETEATMQEAAERLKNLDLLARLALFGFQNTKVANMKKGLWMTFLQRVFHRSQKGPTDE